MHDPTPPPGSKGTGRLRWLAKRLFLLLVSMALTLVVTELVLRWTILPVETLYHFEQGAVVADEVLGYRLRPDQRTVMTNGHFVEEVRTDSRGLRDVWRDDLPNPGLIAIGDSQTFGHGIAAEQTWVEQLQDQLGVNVINTGVFGYAVTQYEEVLRRLDASGQPILAVLFAMTYNDAISGAVPSDSNTVVDGYVVRNPAYADAGTSASLRQRITGSAAFELLTRRLALGRLVRSAVPALEARLGLEVIPEMERRLAAQFAETQGELLSIRDFLAARGAVLVIVHIANSNFVIPERWSSYGLRYRHSRFVVRESFGPWAAEHGVVFADAIEPLEEHYVAGGSHRTALMLPVNDHYNAAANGVVAGVFRRLLEEHGILEAAHDPGTTSARRP